RPAGRSRSRWGRCSSGPRSPSASRAWGHSSSRSSCSRSHRWRSRRASASGPQARASCALRWSRTRTASARRCAACASCSVMAERAMRIGLVGFGTIGTGVVRALASHGDLVAERLGFRLELGRIADIDLERDRGVALGGARLTKDWREIVNDPEIELVVELVGGTRVARELVLAALDAGKSVGTANKALLATHGAEIYALAASKRTEIAFEASVGGTIPVLRALREGLCADRVKALHGIVNGTCNFILTQMEANGEPYEVCLKRAQELGYAEP